MVFKKSPILNTGTGRYTGFLGQVDTLGSQARTFQGFRSEFPTSSSSFLTMLMCYMP